MHCTLHFVFLFVSSIIGSSDPYVKVKIGDKMLHKSKTINRDLNPTWDETFILPIVDINQHVVFKVGLIILNN